MLSAVGRAWGRLRGMDPWLLDGLLAVGLSVAAGAQLLTEEPGNVRRLLPVVGTCLPLVLRRRYSILAHALQVASAVLSQRQPVTVSMLAIFIGVYSVAVYSRWRRYYLVWIVIGAAILEVMFPLSAVSVPSWISLLVGGFGLWLAGSAVHDRQLRGDMLEERAQRLEHERELSTRVALADERQRIARELHDVVAHSVSVMVVQTGAARTLLTRAPNEATTALLAVERSGREALGELRNLLGLLTEADAEPALAPQPGLGQLDRLVERVGQAGLPIDLQIGGIPRELPPGLDLTAYRIVQEALTNALKYAGGAQTQVRVEFGERELRLEVLDAGPGRSNGGSSTATTGNEQGKRARARAGATGTEPGHQAGARAGTTGTEPGQQSGARAGSAGAEPGEQSGRGLLGMQQRVAVYGGQLEAGQRPEGGFAVRARLPLQPV